MKLRNVFNTPSIMVRVGSLCLVLAILTNSQNVFGIREFLTNHFLNGNAYDAVNGFLYGVAVSCLLRFVWLRAHRGPNAGTRACGS